MSRFFEERRSTMRMIQEHEGRFRCFSGSMKDRWMEHKQKLIQAVSSVLLQGVAENEIRRDIPPALMASLLLGMMRARGQDYAHAPEARPPVDLVVALFLQGAGREAPADRNGKDAGAKR